MINEVDGDGNGEMGFHEFLIMMAHRSNASDPEAEVREAFKVFDKDGDGKITIEELKIALHNLGDDMTDEEVHDMVKEIDANGDGHVNYEEFAHMLSSI